MPRKLKLDSLKAELSTVNSLLEESISIKDPIGQLQYEHKKESIEKEIQEIENTVQTNASIALYFGGKPVFGSRGILADFAGRTLEEFQDLISKVFAKYEYGDLGHRGKIPLKNNTQLMITEISKGSFGFILEELSDQLEITETSLKKIVNEVSLIISKTTDENETVFEELLPELDERILISLRNFFAHLDNNEATLRLIEDKNEYKLNAPEIHRGRFRTEAITIEDKETIITGILVGFLPEHKKFELKDEEGKVIYGNATDEAAEQYFSILSSGNPILNIKWKISAIVRTVVPINRKQKTIYTLLKFLEQL
jgi:hypothetical protein